MDFDAILEGPFMVILRGLPAEETIRRATLAWDAGINAVEVPIGRPDQVAVLAATVAAGRERGQLVGAGTVITLEQVEAAVRAGAAYTVAPSLDVSVLRASQDAGLPHLPGIATPTELRQALAAGCSWVKAFPAISLGPAWYRAIRGPFPDVHTVATGGITPQNALDFLAEGARVVGLGDAVTDLDLLKLLVEAGTRPGPD